jgi:hypothetical protein
MFIRAGPKDHAGALVLEIDREAHGWTKAADASVHHEGRLRAGLGIARRNHRNRILRAKSGDDFLPDHVGDFPGKVRRRERKPTNRYSRLNAAGRGRQAGIEEGGAPQERQRTGSNERPAARLEACLYPALPRRN